MRIDGSTAGRGWAAKGPPAWRPSSGAGFTGALALVICLAISGPATALAAVGGQPKTTDMTGMAGMAMPSPENTSYWDGVGGAAFHPTGQVRTYYVGADEVVWNYAPDGRDDITGQAFDPIAKTYVQSGPGRIGTSYLKCLYRGYTDANFASLAPRSPQDAYLGFLGPVIRAEVGDTIKVVFRNACRISDSVHAHGVFYTKANEGTPYADNTSGVDKLDDAIPTGGTHTYTWLVPDRAGPGPHDGSSVMWMYHSHTSEVTDTYAGLIGPMVITAKGKARPDGSPADVDREIFTLLTITNENWSPYLQENLRRFAQQPYPSQDDSNFVRSNLRHGINGYIFGNEPMITIKKDEHVRWYVMSMGGEQDLHTPHWHGNDAVVGGMRMDTVPLLPGTMAVADMVPDNVGIWLFHCHVNEHITAGMLTRYQVVSGTGTGSSSTGGTGTTASASGSGATTMPVPKGAVSAGEGGIANPPSAVPAASAVAAIVVMVAGRRIVRRRRSRTMG
ncbi:multicopper oxidase domain-containing protein [Frankia sp. Cas3]|uniref:multicopper oxidase domain-containing protein n=1 Tax=Frankia sp. Cas3 TaxID=3073926 RepID=UPI002AD310AD|nr:multicopper oxidase domain-containing protein [Frankia sp. Cas3]